MFFSKRQISPKRIFGVGEEINPPPARTGRFKTTVSSALYGSRVVYTARIHVIIIRDMY